ncbi:MAG: hypothetical protein FWD67_09760 [Betaproteobacteria bacterium]|nr:hypothetical protein [Betaproteobacteria bacterium]
MAFKFKDLFLKEEPKNFFDIGSTDISPSFETDVSTLGTPEKRYDAPSTPPRKKVTFTQSGEWTDDVEAIYAGSNHAEELKSEDNIYKVRQLVDKLPKDLAKGTIQETLVGILSVTSISATTLQKDANLRKEVLAGYLQSSRQEMEQKSDDLRASIENAEKSIEAAKQQLADIRTAGSNVEVAVSNEIEQIKELESFLLKEQKEGV